MNSCPRCHSVNAVVERQDEYGTYFCCWFCAWTDNGLAGAEPFKIKHRGKAAIGKELTLPTAPSNYAPWRERERLAWEKEINETQA